MKSFAVILGLAALAVGRVAAATEFEEEDDVLVLDDDNFDDAIAEHETLLVEFYAPWCGHCKSLAPEYAKAAATLKKEGLRIAKVDATANRELSDRFSIQGFPTLKFFRSGKPMDYNGQRTADSIASWVVKKSGPAATELKDAAEVAAFKESADVTVVGFFAAAKGESFSTFMKVAGLVDDVKFAFTRSAEARSEAEVSGSGDEVVLFKSFDEGRADFDGSLASTEELESFVNARKMPLVIAFSQETANVIFGGPVQKHLLVFADPEMDGYDSFKAEIGEVAKEVRGKVLCITVAPSEDRVMSYFDLTTDDLPTAVLVDMSGEGMLKYVLEEKPTEASMRSFVEAFFAGGLKPHLKSEEPEEDDLSGPVAVLRGKTFADVALDEEKDVLVEFYAPWCGHCKALAPTYEKLGKKFADVDSVVIAKMDATANEVNEPGVNVRGFPTLYFFPSGKGAKPMAYEGGRSLDDFVSFLQENAQKPFELSDEGEHDEL